ncbi:microtubule-associated tumor suppressor candidate 2-like isoform X2 [Chiloscyllium plagiosum]|uniref:microtubule-associated tumor suppressor candidate 2-like isoform X2 n=1 Tax=Chiloscyllium plagiosum TaxID=36176 RepID=UPI001CB800ED|nr:microtubule-associated tumor suppressor candidate 2-like isoform X2 [Chiloscyllium plagiosum]
MTSSVQNSTFCTDKEGNTKEVENNNQQPVGTDGDTNANEIASQTLLTEERQESPNLTAGIVNEHLHITRNTIPEEFLEDPVSQGRESQSAEGGNQSNRSRDLEFSELRMCDKIETVELDNTEYAQHHEKVCSLQFPAKEDQKSGTSKIISVSQIQKEWYTLRRQPYAAGSAAEHQWLKKDVSDDDEKMHSMQFSHKESSSCSSLQKATKMDGSVETTASKDNGIGCLPDGVTVTDRCTGSLNFQEFYIDIDRSTHDSQRESEDLFKTISPSDPSDLTSVETTGFHINSVTSENRMSVPKLQANVARPLNLVNVSPSHCENIISTTASGNDLLVAINKPETQTNLKVLSDQCNTIDAHSQIAKVNQQETGEFLPEITVQSRRNISEVKEGIDPCDVSQQSLTLLPAETAKIESSKEQYLISPSVEEDQPLVQQVECYTGDNPVPGNNSSVLMRPGYKNRIVSPLQNELYSIHDFTEAAEHLGSSISSATSNVASMKSTVSTAPSTTHQADNDIERDKLPVTGTNDLSKQEFISLHEAFEIIDGRKEDRRQSFGSGNISSEHKAVEMKSISSVTAKDNSETLNIAQSELSKHHPSVLGRDTGMGGLPRQGVSLDQNDGDCSVKKTDSFSQRKKNEINSNVIIIGEKQLIKISEELQHSESPVVSQTVNPAIATCTEVQQLVNMKATSRSSDSGFKETSLLNAGTSSESSLPHPIGDMQTMNSFSKASDKVVCSSGIPKPILQHPRTVLTDKGEIETNYQPMSEGKTEAKPIPKPKYVRPKIITYIRKPLQVKPLDAIHDALGLPPKLSTWTESISKPCISKEHKTSVCENKPLSVLSVPGSAHDRYRPELQRTKIYTTGLMVSGIKPPTQQTFPRMMGKPFPSCSDVAPQKVPETFTQERISETDTPSLGQFTSGQNVASVPEECFNPATHTAVSRLPKTLRPPLGLGAISRLPAAKSRLALQSQRTSLNSSALQIQGQADQEIAVEQKKNTIPIVQRSSLPKYPGHSGLRPPGYSRLPAAKLVAFGFVRSSSVSSVSSNQSNDSAHSDHSKAANRSNSGSEEKVTLKTGVSVSDVSKRTGKIGRQPSSSSTTCWSLLPASKSKPAGTMKKEVHKDHDVPKPVNSSPKRHVTPASKLHPAGISKLRSAAGITRNGFSAKTDLQSRETERQTIQRLKDKCKKQAKQLQSFHDQLQRASLSIEVLAVTTQHFHQKNESALIKEKELSIELAHIREEVALNTTRCEKLQKEKEELERRFENELQRLHLQQQEELLDLEERLKAHYASEKERLMQEHQEYLKKIQSQHEEQMEDLVANHSSAITEMENNQTVTITILQDEHEKKIEDLKAIHELERSALEEDFEKLRLSLQDQVDTLTFQNHSLKDKAKRFEEALRRSTDEQVEIALAPYQHLEEDMNSLKHVLEMKNQQIHQQEKKIIELEKLAEKNVVLEEKVQVLQQQNEDLKARIDNNVALTRQLSEENATLHEYVEKESKEMKRLSRTNEELVWRLQTGEPVSPVKISSSSSNFQSSQGTLFPSAVSANPR